MKHPCTRQALIPPKTAPATAAENRQGMASALPESPADIAALAAEVPVPRLQKAGCGKYPQALKRRLVHAGMARLKPCPDAIIHRPIPWAGTIAVTAALLQLACGGASPPAETAAAGTPVPVQVVTLRPAPLEDFYEAPGTVRARESAGVASKVTGTVMEVAVELGDTVRAGQPLVRIESEEMDAGVRSAEAAATAAARAVTQAEKGLEAAEAEAHLARVTFERFQGLLERRSVSQQEFDQAEAGRKAAEAAVAMAAARVEEARAGQAQAAAALESARIRRGYAEITAPFAGVVSERRVDPGALAVPGMSLLALEKAGEFRLEASVPETHVAGIKVGNTVRVSIPSIDWEGEGRVAEMEPSTDAVSRAALVRITIPPATGLRSGLFGRARFSLGRVTLLTVPEKAVVRDGQLVSVFVVSDGVARRRLVTLGRTFGEQMEALSGLTENEQIVVAPGALTEGAAVEIRP